MKKLVSLFQPFSPTKPNRRWSEEHELRECTAGAGTKLQNLSDRRTERGAALLMTLLLIAALSAVAVAMSDAMSLAARRAANAGARDQALWHLLGAEQLARQILLRDIEASPDRTIPDAPWARGAIAFPTDAGRIEGEIVDRSNCFNLNSLGVRDDRRAYTANPAARAELVALAAALEAPEADAERFAAAAADWIDRDDAPSGRGAEDFDYATLEPPYRTGATLFAEPEEARALAGADERLFRTLQPLLCAHPDTAPSVLDANTLQADDAALLTALFGGALDGEAAREVIAGRPAGGWTTVAEFWAVPEIAALIVDEETRRRVALTTSYFELRARVYHEGAYVEGASLLRRVGGAVSVVRRRVGSGE